MSCLYNAAEIMGFCRKAEIVMVVHVHYCWRLPYRPSSFYYDKSNSCFEMRKADDCFYQKYLRFLFREIVLSFHCYSIHMKQCQSYKCYMYSWVSWPVLVTESSPSTRLPPHPRTVYLSTSSVMASFSFCVPHYSKEPISPLLLVSVF